MKPAKVDQHPLHVLPESVQQQADSLPSIPLIMALAQPTPERTVKAPVGQFLLHAPHSMQASWSEISTRFPFMRNTS
jgi:hypothetical protein